MVMVDRPGVQSTRDRHDINVNERIVNGRPSLTVKAIVMAMLILFGISNLTSRAGDSLQFGRRGLLRNIIFLGGDGSQRGKSSENCLS